MPKIDNQVDIGAIADWRIGSVIGVAVDTTGTVIAAPFMMANAAVGGGHHDRHHGQDHSEHDTEHSEHENTHSGHAQEQPAS